MMPHIDATEALRELLALPSGVEGSGAESGVAGAGVPAAFPADGFTGVMTDGPAVRRR